MKFDFVIPYDMLESSKIEPLACEIGYKFKMNNFNLEVVENDMSSLRIRVIRIKDEEKVK